MTDPIERQAAINAVNCGALSAAMVYGRTDEGSAALYETVKAIKALPSAQPERLTDDDFETIRIHLNAYKEKLCNLHRWEEAEEYQRIIDRFMAFASAQPTPCDVCRHNPPSSMDGKPCCVCPAERRTDETN